VRAISDNVTISNSSTESTSENYAVTETIISAVQTRAQIKAETKSFRSLKHTIIDALNKSPDDFPNCR